MGYRLHRIRGIGLEVACVKCACVYWHDNLECNVTKLQPDASCWVDAECWYCFEADEVWCDQEDVWFVHYAAMFTGISWIQTEYVVINEYMYISCNRELIIKTC